MGMCNVVAGLIRKTMSRAFVPDCELGIQTKNLTGRNVALGHVPITDGVALEIPLWQRYS